MLLRTIAGVSALVSCVLFACAGWAFWTLPLLFVGIYAALFLLALLFLCVVCGAVNLNKPQEEDSKFYRAVMHLYIEALIQLVRVRLHTKGLENTPKEGRFLLVCNHLSLLDPVVIYYCFQRSQLAFISKKENNGMFLVGKAMHKLMAQLINRENDREALKTILKCVQLLKEDEVSIAVFPEGYTSRDHHLQKLRSGSLKIATKAKVPIAVCTLQGTEQVKVRMKRLRSTPIQLHLVDVITPEQQQGRTAVDLGEQIYQMMARDLGPDYAPLEAENP